MKLENAIDIQLPGESNPAAAARLWCGPDDPTLLSPRMLQQVEDHLRARRWRTLRVAASRIGRLLRPWKVPEGE